MSDKSLCQQPQNTALTSMSGPKPRLVMVEMNSQADMLCNLLAIEYSVSQAKHAGAQLVVLPENAFCFGPQALAAAQFEALADWAGQLARQHQVYLLAGTLPCPFRPDGSTVPDNKFRQSSLLFDPGGQQVARYDKLHLFKATVNDPTGRYDEGKTFEPGNQLTVAKTALGTIGLMVCFDIRFAPLALRLRELGAQILTVPSAFTYQTGKAHWQKLLTARALDSQCLVVGAGQDGTHTFYKNGQAQQRQTWGHSQIINAHGEVISESLAFDQRHDCDFNLTRQAKSWLTGDSNVQVQHCQDPQQLRATMTTTRLITALFDPLAQQHWRETLPIFDNQRFGLTDPLVGKSNGLNNALSEGRNDALSLMSASSS